jgi:predicted nucleic acid-binding protein
VKPPAVVDTNVASYVYGEKPEAKLYEDDLADRVLFLSFQTIAEMLEGAERRKWGKAKRAGLAAFLASHKAIFPSDNTLAVWARMRAALKEAGHGLSHPDSWVAACALSLGMPLIAHDGAFRFVPGLELISHLPAVGS